MSKPGLLLWNESAERFLGDAFLDRFDVIRFWQASKPDAILDARGKDVVATLTWRLDASTLDRLPNLRLIVVPGAGYDAVDVVAARARGVTVANAGAAHSSIVADHAVALTLASIHRLPEMERWLREGNWKGEQPRRHAMLAQRFGIVGLGNIGTAVAERLAPFGGEIAWWSRSAKPARWPRHESLLELAHWCTALIVATRGSAVGLINAETIAAVGPGRPYRQHFARLSDRRRCADLGAQRGAAWLCGAGRVRRRADSPGQMAGCPQYDPHAPYRGRFA